MGTVLPKLSTYFCFHCKWWNVPPLWQKKLLKHINQSTSKEEPQFWPTVLFAGFPDVKQPWSRDWVIVTALFQLMTQSSIAQRQRMRDLLSRHVGGWWWPHYPMCTPCCGGCHVLQDTPVASAPTPLLSFPPASLAQRGHPGQVSPLLHPVWYFLTASVSFQKT